MKFFPKINKTGNKQKILSNVMWAMGGKIVNMIGNLFVGILVARYLGPEQYGVMNYVISYVALFSIIATFGLSNIEVRELSRSLKDRDTIMGTCFRLRLFFASMGYSLIFLTLLLFRTDVFTSAMILVYGLVLYTGCFEVIRNYFTSIVYNEYVVKSEICRTVVGAVVKIGLLWIKAPLEYFIIATMFDTFLVSSVYIVSYQNKVGRLLDWKYDRTKVSYYLKQAFPLVLSGAAVIIYQRIDQVMIGNMIDKQSVGYFATASRFLEIILFLPHVLSQTVTPMLVKTYKDKPYEQYEEKARQFVSIVVWSSIIMALVVSLSSNWLISLTFGGKYVAAIPVLQILAFKTVGMALSSSGGQLIIIEKIQKWAFVRNILGCVVCVSLNYLLIPYYGIIGSAFVTIITLLVSGCLSNAFIPSYRHIFRIEIYALINGWKHLAYLKQFVK